MGSIPLRRGRLARLAAAAALLPALCAPAAPRQTAQWEPRPPSRASEEGRLVYQRHGCAACHAVGGDGGSSGPALDGIGGRRSVRYLRGQISDPEDFARAYPQMHGWEPSWMPHPHASPMEVDLLVAYLLTLPARAERP